jgi:hypothetical protein
MMAKSDLQEDTTDKGASKAFHDLSWINMTESDQKLSSVAMRNERAAIWKEEQGNEMTGLFGRGWLKNVNIRGKQSKISNPGFEMYNFQKITYFVPKNCFFIPLTKFHTYNLFFVPLHIFSYLIKNNFHTLINFFIPPHRPSIRAGSQPALNSTFNRPGPDLSRPGCHGGCNKCFFQGIVLPTRAASMSSKKKREVQEGPLVKMLERQRVQRGESLMRTCLKLSSWMTVFASSSLTWSS